MRVKGQSLLAAHRLPAHRGVISPGLPAPEPHAENTAALVHPAASEGGPEYPKAPYPPRGPPAQELVPKQARPPGRWGHSSVFRTRQGAPVVSGGCGARPLTSPPAVAMATASPARASEPPVSWQPPDLRSPSTGTGPRVALASKRRQWAVPAAGGGAGRGLRGAGRGGALPRAAGGGGALTCGAARAAAAALAAAARKAGAGAEQAVERAASRVGRTEGGGGER